MTDARRQRDVVEHGSAELALEALIAEFTSLRNEITSRIGSQLTLILGAGTIVGAIIGIVVSQKGNAALLSIVPLVTGVLGFVHTDNTRFINYAAKYIRDELWPTVAALTGYAEQLPSWERTVSQIVWNMDARLRTQNILMMPLAYGFFGVVPGACLAYLAITKIDRLNGIGMVAFVLGAVVTAFYVVIAIDINRQFSRSLSELVSSPRDKGEDSESTNGH
jgi:hypothetical protein